jgi:hypothetical protein
VIGNKKEWLTRWAHTGIGEGGNGERAVGFGGRGGFPAGNAGARPECGGTVGEVGGAGSAEGVIVEDGSLKDFIGKALALGRDGRERHGDW